MVAAAANAYVGRTVTVEWGNYPPDTTRIQFLQMREAAGNMPEILLLDDLMWNAEGYEYAIKKGLIKEIKLADLTTYMNGYVARFKQYGVDVSYAISENSKTSGAGHRQALVHPLPVRSGTVPREQGSEQLREAFSERRPCGAACSATTSSRRSTRPRRPRRSSGS